MIRPRRSLLFMPGSNARALEKARNLFRQGLSLEAAGNWAAALAKFQEVMKVKLTPQVRFHSARCSEQLGRLNEALGEYRLAEYEAGQQGLALNALVSPRWLDRLLCVA